MEDRKLRMTSIESRETLKVALGDRAAAEAALAHAREVSDRARSILEEIVRQGEAIDARMRQSLEALADEMRGAVLTGPAPSVSASDREAAKTEAARAALDARRAAAERVVSDFAAAEREAASTFEEAQAAVAGAIKAVVRGEAAALAAKWAVGDAEARALRARLGVAYGVVSQIGALDDGVLRGITANTDDRTDLEVNAAVEASWSTLAAELQRDPEARIDFGPVDRAREEAKAARSRSHATDEEIQVQLAQFRSRPASPAPADDPCWLDLMADEAIA
jgi:hypothetical protein